MIDASFSIKFYFEKAITLRNRRDLQHFIASQLNLYGKCGAEICFVFCSDEKLLEINKKHLNHDYYTDIITFDLSEKNDCRLVSDIYISVDRVRNNAKSEKETTHKELLRVVFHGLLHLVGYKDKTSVQSAEMRAKENAWINKFISEAERSKFNKK